jgi:putative NADPH-quinone reductase
MKITIIQGHPDPTNTRFCRALARAYGDGARAAGHEVRHIDVAGLDFPLLRTKHDFEQGRLPVTLSEPQRSIAWAEHLVVIHPLWLGEMPALLKGFFEQTLRPGFAFPATAGGAAPPTLRGKSARVIVTMGMPAVVYRWYYRAHGLKSLTRSVLGFVGIAPVYATLVGSIEGLSERQRARWLERVERLGRAGR